MKKRIVIFMFLFLVIIGVNAMELTNNVGVQYPLGFQIDTRLFQSIKLFDSKSILFKDSRIEFGIQNKFSPAYNYIGPRIYFEPIAVFDLTISGGFFTEYKALGYGFMKLTDYKSDFSDATLSNLEQSNANGYYVYANPEFKIAFGKIIFSHSFLINYWNFKNVNSYYYERITRSVLKSEDYNLENESYLFYKFNKKLMVGLDHYFLFVPGSKLISQRLTTIAVYTPNIKIFKKSYFVFILGPFIRDRYEKIYGALLFGFNMDVFGGKK